MTQRLNGSPTHMRTKQGSPFRLFFSSRFSRRKRAPVEAQWTEMFLDCWLENMRALVDLATSPSVPPTPARLLSSAHLSRFLDTLRGMYHRTWEWSPSRHLFPSSRVNYSTRVHTLPFPSVQSVLEISHWTFTIDQQFPGQDKTGLC